MLKLEYEKEGRIMNNTKVYLTEIIDNETGMIVRNDYVLAESVDHARAQVKLKYAVKYDWTQYHITAKETNISKSEFYRKQRQLKIEFWQSRINTNDGAKGKIFELECATKNSRKTDIGEVNESDVYIHVGGKNANIKAEVKTNGGRIEKKKKKKNPAKYVIYRLDIDIKLPAGKTRPARIEHRHIDPVVIPTDVFINALIRFNAIKNTNGKQPERAIQVTSKKLYNWLLEWPIPYDPTLIYQISDFEGLE